MSPLKFIFQDWAINQQNAKARFVLLMYRSACLARNARFLVRIPCLPYLIFYRIFVQWVMCIEIPWKTQIGPNLRVFHGFGLVIHDRTVIGSNVVLRHNTTIGVKNTNSFHVGQAPTIGSNVDIGANVVILGGIKIGDGARIGAGAVVIKDVPAGFTAVGNPARVFASK